MAVKQPSVQVDSEYYKEAKKAEEAEELARLRKEIARLRNNISNQQSDAILNSAEMHQEITEKSKKIKSLEKTINDIYYFRRIQIQSLRRTIRFLVAGIILALGLGYAAGSNRKPLKSSQSKASVESLSNNKIIQVYRDLPVIDSLYGLDTDEVIPIDSTTGQLVVEILDDPVHKFDAFNSKYTVVYIKVIYPNGSVRYVLVDYDYLVASTVKDTTSNAVAIDVVQAVSTPNPVAIDAAQAVSTFDAGVIDAAQSVSTPNAVAIDAAQSVSTPNPVAIDAAQSVSTRDAGVVAAQSDGSDGGNKCSDSGDNCDMAPTDGSDSGNKCSGSGDNCDMAPTDGSDSGDNCDMVPTDGGLYRNTCTDDVYERTNNVYILLKK